MTPEGLQALYANVGDEKGRPRPFVLARVHKVLSDIGADLKNDPAEQGVKFYQVVMLAIWGIRFSRYERELVPEVLKRVGEGMKQLRDSIPGLPRGSYEKKIVDRIVSTLEVMITDIDYAPHPSG